MPRAPRKRSRDSVCRVLYIGIHDSGYPRNARIRAFLEEQASAEVLTVPASRGRTRVGRHASQLGAVLKAPGPWDAVVLAEFSLSSAWLTWLKARSSRATHVVDFFVGTYETDVEDRQLYAPRSLRALKARLIDMHALRLADIVLSDTDARATTLQPRTRPSAPVYVLPVGAPEWARDVPPLTIGEACPLRVLYYGNYIELHGVDYSLRALAMLRDLGLPFSATFVGDGACKSKALQVAARLQLEPVVDFRPPVPQAELGQLLAEHHVVMGVFGGSSKAGSVIANKVWQGLSAGRFVVTRRSHALDEICELAGPLLLQVEPESATTIAEALRQVESRRHRLPESLAIASTLDQYVRRRYEQAFASAFGVRHRPGGGPD